MFFLNLLKLAFSIMSVFFAGYIPVYCLFLKDGKKAFKYRSISGRLYIFFLSFFTGSFLSASYLMALSLLKISFSFTSAAAFGIFFFIPFLFLFIKKEKSFFRYREEIKNSKENLCLKNCMQGFFKSKKANNALFSAVAVLIAFNFFVVSFFTFLFPVRFWDAISSWSFKGIAFFKDGSILPFFTGHSYTFSHLSYPLYLPLIQTWAYTWLGYADETLVKVIFPLFYLSLIVIIYRLFKESAGKTIAIILAYIISGLPVILDHGYIEYTNLLFSVVLLTGVYFFYIYAQKFRVLGKTAIEDLIPAAIFFTILAQIRSEGVLYLIIFFILNLAIVLNAVVNKRAGCVKVKLFKNKLLLNLLHTISYIIIPAAVYFLLSLPWLILRQNLKISALSNEWISLFGGSFPGAGQGGQAAYIMASFDAGGAAGALVGQFLFSAHDSARAYLGSSYGIAWFALLVLFIINFKRCFKDYAWIFSVFAATGILSLFISLALIEEFRWSTDRYVLHLFPLTYFWILYNLPMLKKGKFLKGKS